jgi:hypothetical protein
MFGKTFSFSSLLLLAGALFLATPGSGQAQHRGGAMMRPPSLRMGTANNVRPRVVMPTRFRPMVNRDLIQRQRLQAASNLRRNLPAAEREIFRRDRAFTNNFNRELGLPFNPFYGGYGSGYGMPYYGGGYGNPGYTTPSYGGYGSPGSSTPSGGGGGSGYSMPSYDSGYPSPSNYDSSFPYVGYDTPDLSPTYGSLYATGGIDAKSIPVPESSTPTLATADTAKVLNAIGVTNDRGQLSYPLGLQVLQPQTENLQLLDKIETLFQVMVNQEIKGELNARMVQATSAAVERLQAMLRARQSNMTENTYGEAQRYLETLRHALNVLQPKGAAG